MAKNTIIVLKTSGNDIFEIEENVAKQSETINRMIIDGCADGVIPLPNITGKIFVKVIEYCKRHAATTPDAEEKEKKEEEKEEEKSKEELKNFDREFINVGQEILIELLMAANYLEIESLLDLGCQKVADMMNSKTPEEIRQTFNIQNDFTPEEEEEIRKSDSWAFR